MSCESAPTLPDNDVFCGLGFMTYNSKIDRPETTEQIDRFNALYVEFCE